MPKGEWLKDGRSMTREDIQKYREANKWVPPEEKVYGDEKELPAESKA